MTVTLVRLGDQRFFIASRDVPLGKHVLGQIPVKHLVELDNRRATRCTVVTPAGQSAGLLLQLPGFPLCAV